jgi:hypothetical protein
MPVKATALNVDHSYLKLIVAGRLDKRCARPLDYVVCRSTRLFHLSSLCVVAMRTDAETLFDTEN